MTNQKKSPLIIILTLGLFCYSFAQESNEKDVYSLTVDDILTTEIVGASMYTQKLNEVPANVIVVSKNEILERGYEDLSDVLKDLPGFDITENAGRFGENYVVRGIDGNDRFLVLVNGRKINAPSGVFLSVGNSMSVRFAERIEVIYGAASVIYGADAFSAIINIVSKEVPEVAKINVQTNYGSFNTLDAMVEGLVPVNEDLSFHFFGRVFNSDGFDFETEQYDTLIQRYTDPIPSNFSQPINDHNFFIEGKYKNMKFGYYRQQFDEGNGRGLVPHIYYYNKENKWKVHQNVIWANYKLELGENKGFINADINHIRYIQDPETQFFKFGIPNNTATTFNQYMTGRDISWKGIFTYNRSFSEKLNFIAGLQLENTNSIPHYANDQVFEGQPLKFEGDVASRIEDDLTIHEKKVGAFSQLSFTPSNKFNVTAGLRFDYSKLFDETVNPRIALIFKPQKQTILKLIFGSAFQAPSLFYQYEQFGTPTIVMIPSNEQDFKLKNQTVETTELNITHGVGEKLVLNASIFHNKAKNLIERNLYTNAVANKYFNNTTPGLRNENIGKQTLIGTTINATLHASKSFQGYFYYTYTKGDAELSSGEEIPVARIAEHKISIGFTYRNQYFAVSPRFRWYSDITTPQGSFLYPGDQKSPGYSTLNLSITSKELIPKVRIFAYFENILNQDIVHAGLLTGGVYVDDIPQPGFNGRFGIQMSF